MPLRISLKVAIDLAMTNGRASSSVWRMRSPPGTSPTPVRPALSRRMTMLRVNSGPCAPLKLSSMLSSPATGITSMSETTGAPLPRSIMAEFYSATIFPASITFFQSYVSAARKSANCEPRGDIRGATGWKRHYHRDVTLRIIRCTGNSGRQRQYQERTNNVKSHRISLPPPANFFCFYAVRNARGFYRDLIVRRVGVIAQDRIKLNSLLPGKLDREQRPA